MIPNFLKATAVASVLATGVMFAGTADAVPAGDYAVSDHGPNAVDHGLWFDPLGNDSNGAQKHWTFTSPGNFNFNGSTTGKLTGTVQNKATPSYKFKVNINYSNGRLWNTSTDKDVAHCRNGAKCDGTGNEVDWHFFDTVKGTLAGLEGLNGLAFSIKGAGPAAQFGIGANDKEQGVLGLSNWFDVEIVSIVHSKYKGGKVADVFGRKGDVNVKTVPEIDAAAGMGSLAALGAMLAFARSRRRQAVI